MQRGAYQWRSAARKAAIRLHLAVARLEQNNPMMTERDSQALEHIVAALQILEETGEL
jgi:hypothetical protein